MKNRRKSQIKSFVVFTLIVSLISLGSIGYVIIRGISNRDQTQDIIKGNASNDFYSLRTNATDYQKTVYAQLSESLKANPVNDSAVAGLVAQNFIADFYTWSNKLTSNDVGGLQYLDSSIKTWVYAQATNTIYNNLSTYLANNTVKDTLTVSASTALITAIDYEFNGVLVSAYSVEVNWQYLPSTVVNVSNYEKSSTVTVIRDTTGRFSVVAVESALAAASGVGE